MLNMGMLLLALARRVSWLEGGVFTRTSKGTIAAKASEQTSRTARSKDSGMKGIIGKNDEDISR